MEVPWFALSPSPFTIIFYLILTVYAYQKIKDATAFNLKNKLLFFTDALLIVGFVVVFLDTYWIVACGLRFGWFFPDSILQLVFAFGRNIAGLILCYMLIGNYFKQKKLEITKWSVRLFLLNISFLAFWFLMASSPAWTDWTYAIRHNYPMQVILTSFFISHVIGKSLVATFFISIWKPQSNSKLL